MATPSARQIFERALEVPRHERDACVDAACAGVVELRAKVLELLRAYEEAGTFMDGAPPPAHTVAEGPGTVIGKYRLVEPIGEGGFGMVFLAEQQEPVRRRVALKVIKLGMDTRQVVGRFEVERQALALMDHPNIARVLDAGATHSGRPYFVMELVQGEPITRYCDRVNLKVEARLGLFCRVCQAVQHAHQKGIIHRDLKPSNVLVTEVDGEPVPKIIDFGIAKAIGSPLTDKTVFTEFRQLVGTPEYMSPEQAAMSGVGVDTRSDIYSLGVLLYELLTGATPFEGARLRSATWDEMLRIIREEEPAKPSTRLSSMKEGLASVAARRRADPTRLKKLARGDLDWIVMKCLEKERARRYESASGLADDVTCHLSGKPVLAAPPSAPYRVRKFLWRNRALAAGATMILLTLGIGLAGALWQAHRAEQAGARAVATNEFLASVLRSPNPFLREPQNGASRRFSPDSRMAELLDEAATWVGTTLAGHPEAEAQVRLTLGESYWGIGRYADSEMQLGCALELHRTWLGRTHERTLECLISLTEALVMQGRISEAESLARRAADEMTAKLGPNHQTTLLAKAALIRVLCDQSDRLDDLEADATSTLDGLRRTAGSGAHITRGMQSVLARMLARVGKLDAAARLAGEIADGKEGAQADFWVWYCTGVQGSVAHQQGKYVVAEQLYRGALEHMRAMLGDRHPMLGLTMRDLGRTLNAQGQYIEAERWLRRALETGWRGFEGEASDMRYTMHHLAVALACQGRLDEALDEQRKRLRLCEEHLDADSLETVSAMNDYADLLRSAGRAGEAEDIARRALARIRATVDADAPSWVLRLRINTLDTLAAILRDTGRVDDSLELFRELEAFRREFQAEQELPAQFRLNHAVCMVFAGQYAEAEKALLKIHADTGAGSNIRHDTIQALVALYDAWHAADPGGSHDMSAAEWRKRLDEAVNTGQPAR